MASKADEFEPDDSVVAAIVDQVLRPSLRKCSGELRKGFAAKLSIVVGDRSIEKQIVTEADPTKSDGTENIEVRVRFRRTFRDDRILFSLETLHDGRNESGYSGVAFRGDVVFADGTPICRVTGQTNRYNTGWTGW